MSSVGLIATLVILGQVAVAMGIGGLCLWIQRKFFLYQDEHQSFAIPGIAAFFASAYYFWVVISIDLG
ncbi:hypothetical protein SEA_YARA_68 [Streptomyces phage Yara]|nr:hypothetical protein SEA_YARA_68 [Streptomyces phage Yara]